MRVYVFKSIKEPDVFGFTSDDTGGNLPKELGPWTQPAGSGADETGSGPIAGVGSSGPAVAAIERDGFYVARSEEISRITGVPWIE